MLIFFFFLIVLLSLRPLKENIYGNMENILFPLQMEQCKWFPFVTIQNISILLSLPMFSDVTSNSSWRIRKIEYSYLQISGCLLINE